MQIVWQFAWYAKAYLLWKMRKKYFKLSSIEDVTLHAKRKKKKKKKKKKTQRISN